MVQRLMVAAGGGGDVIASVMVHHALAGPDEPVHVLTYAWDRLLVDPLPGPRTPADFEGLQSVSEHVHQILPSSKALPPAGSTLPQLAADLPRTNLYLMDPSGGAKGIRTQLAELVEALGVDHVDVVDVGGDIVAEGDEPTLRSPFADALALAGAGGLTDVSVLVHIAGPGLDGELSVEQVQERLSRGGAERTARLAPEHVTPVRGIFRWHPSEATGLLAIAALGLRGVAEIRDHGLRVQLGEDSAAVFTLALNQALTLNPGSRALLETTSLERAEEDFEAAGVRNELVYERRKAAQDRVTVEDQLDPKGITERIQAAGKEAHERGVDLLTVRRLGHLLSMAPVQLPELRRILEAEFYPGRYVAPVLRTV